MVGYRNTSDVTKSCTEKRAITGPWWVLSIIEVIKQLGYGIASKPKTQNPEQHF